MGWIPGALAALVNMICCDAKEYSFQAGTWPGTIVYNDKSGAFEDGYISSDYKSGITSVNGQATAQAADQAVFDILSSVVASSSTVQ